MHYLLFIVAWLVFGLSHSLLARPEIAAKVPLPQPIYRLLYNALALVLLWCIALLHAGCKEDQLWTLSKPLQWLVILLGAKGIVIALLAFRHYDWKAFLGFTPELKRRLNTSGLNGLMRHPLYTGSMMSILAFALLFPAPDILISTGMAMLYFVIGSYHEERGLVKAFGLEYVEYQRNVPRFWPKLSAVVEGIFR